MTRRRRPASPAASCAGSAATGAAACPGRTRAIPTASGCPKSCCSRRRWPRCWATTRASSRAFPTCRRWPRRRWTTCWRCGAAWATTAARATCTAARRRWWRASAARFPRSARSSCRRCPASAVHRGGDRRPSASASASPSWTATSSACSRGCWGSTPTCRRPRNERALWDTAHGAAARAASCSEAMPRYTQGLMDLGATVCLPRNPSCLLCPVQRAVRGAARGHARALSRSRRASSSAAPQSLWLLQARDRATARCGWRSARRRASGPGCTACRCSTAATRCWQRRCPATRATAARRRRLSCMCSRTRTCTCIRCRCDAAGAALGGRRRRSGSAPSEWPALGLPAPVRKLLERLSAALQTARPSSRCRLSVVQRSPNAARQLLHQVHRAVLPAGAADGHRHVAAVVARQRLQPVVEELLDVAVHAAPPRRARAGSRPPAASQPGQVAQRRLVVRVGQHAHVEHVVGIDRDAALEGEGLEHQRQLADAAPTAAT